MSTETDIPQPLITKRKEEGEQMVDQAASSAAGKVSEEENTEEGNKGSKPAIEGENFKISHSVGDVSSEQNYLLTNASKVPEKLEDESSVSHHGKDKLNDELLEFTASKEITLESNGSGQVLTPVLSGEYSQMKDLGTSVGDSVCDPKEETAGNSSIQDDAEQMENDAHSIKEREKPCLIDASSRDTGDDEPKSMHRAKNEDDELKKDELFEKTDYTESALLAGETTTQKDMESFEAAHEGIKSSNSVQDTETKNLIEEKSLENPQEIEDDTVEQITDKKEETDRTAYKVLSDEESEQKSTVSKMKYEQHLEGELEKPSVTNTDEPTLMIEDKIKDENISNAGLLENEVDIENELLKQEGKTVKPVEFLPVTYEVHDSEESRTLESISLAETSHKTLGGETESKTPEILYSKDEPLVSQVIPTSATNVEKGKNLTNEDSSGRECEETLGKIDEIESESQRRSESFETKEETSTVLKERETAPNPTEFLQVHSELGETNVPQKRAKTESQIEATDQEEDGKDEESAFENEVKTEHKDEKENNLCNDGLNTGNIIILEETHNEKVSKSLPEAVVDIEASGTDQDPTTLSSPDSRRPNTIPEGVINDKTEEKAIEAIVNDKDVTEIVSNENIKENLLNWGNSSNAELKEHLEESGIPHPIEASAKEDNQEPLMIATAKIDHQEIRKAESSECEDDAESISQKAQVETPIKSVQATSEDVIASDSYQDTESKFQIEKRLNANEQMEVETFDAAETNRIIPEEQTFATGLANESENLLIQEDGAETKHGHLENAIKIPSLSETSGVENNNDDSTTTHKGKPEDRDMHRVDNVEAEKNAEIALTKRETPGQNLETLGEDVEEAKEISSCTDTKTSSLDGQSVVLNQKELVSDQTEEKILDINAETQKRKEEGEQMVDQAASSAAGKVSEEENTEEVNKGCKPVIEGENFQISNSVGDVSFEQNYLLTNASKAPENLEDESSVSHHRKDKLNDELLKFTASKEITSESNGLGQVLTPVLSGEYSQMTDSETSVGDAVFEPKEETAGNSLIQDDVEQMENEAHSIQEREKPCLIDASSRDTGDESPKPMHRAKNEDDELKKDELFERTDYTESTLLVEETTTQKDMESFEEAHEGIKSSISVQDTETKNLIEEKSLANPQEVEDDIVEQTTTDKKEETDQTAHKVLSDEETEQKSTVSKMKYEQHLEGELEKPSVTNADEPTIMIEGKIKDENISNAGLLENKVDIEKVLLKQEGNAVKPVEFLPVAYEVHDSEESRTLESISLAETSHKAPGRETESKTPEILYSKDEPLVSQVIPTSVTNVENERNLTNADSSQRKCPETLGKIDEIESESQRRSESFETKEEITSTVLEEREIASKPNESLQVYSELGETNVPDKSAEMENQIEATDQEIDVKNEESEFENEVKTEHKDGKENNLCDDGINTASIIILEETHNVKANKFPPEAVVDIEASVTDQDPTTLSSPDARRPITIPEGLMNDKTEERTIEAIVHDKDVTEIVSNENLKENLLNWGNSSNAEHKEHLEESGIPHAIEARVETPIKSIQATCEDVIASDSYQHTEGNFQIEKRLNVNELVNKQMEVETFDAAETNQIIPEEQTFATGLANESESLLIQEDGSETKHEHLENAIKLPSLSETSGVENTNDDSTTTHKDKTEGRDMHKLDNVEAQKNAEIALTNRETPGENLETSGEDLEAAKEFSSFTDTKTSSLDGQSIVLNQKELVSDQTEEEILDTKAETQDVTEIVSNEKIKEDLLNWEGCSKIEDEEHLQDNENSSAIAASTKEDNDQESLNISTNKIKHQEMPKAELLECENDAERTLEKKIQVETPIKFVQATVADVTASDAREGTENNFQNAERLIVNEIRDEKMEIKAFDAAETEQKDPEEQTFAAVLVYENQCSQIQEDGSEIKHGQLENVIKTPSLSEPPTVENTNDESMTIHEVGLKDENLPKVKKFEGEKNLEIAFTKGGTHGEKLTENLGEDLKDVKECDSRADTEISSRDGQSFFANQQNLSSDQIEEKVLHITPECELQVEVSSHPTTTENTNDESMIVHEDEMRDENFLKVDKFEGERNAEIELSKGETLEKFVEALGEDLKEDKEFDSHADTKTSSVNGQSLVANQQELVSDQIEVKILDIAPECEVEVLSKPSTMEDTNDEPTIIHEDKSKDEDLVKVDQLEGERHAEIEVSKGETPREKLMEFLGEDLKDAKAFDSLAGTETSSLDGQILVANQEELVSDQIEKKVPDITTEQQDVIEIVSNENIKGDSLNWINSSKAEEKEHLEESEISHAIEASTIEDNDQESLNILKGKNEHQNIHRAEILEYENDKESTSQEEALIKAPIKLVEATIEDVTTSDSYQNKEINFQNEKRPNVNEIMDEQVQIKAFDAAETKQTIPQEQIFAAGFANKNERSLSLEDVKHGHFENVIRIPLLSETSTIEKANDVLSTSHEDKTEEENLLKVDKFETEKKKAIALTNKTSEEDLKGVEEDTNIISLDWPSTVIDQQELVNDQTGEKILDITHETQDSIRNASDEKAQENALIQEHVSEMRNKELPGKEIKSLPSSETSLVETNDEASPIHREDVIEKEDLKVDNITREKYSKISEEEAMEIYVGSSKEELEGLKAFVPCEYKETSSLQEQCQKENLNEIVDNHPNVKITRIAPEAPDSTVSTENNENNLLKAVNQSQVRQEGIVEKERKMSLLSEIATVENENEASTLRHHAKVADENLNKFNEFESVECIEKTLLWEEPHKDRSIQSLEEDVRNNEGSVSREHAGSTSHIEEQSQPPIPQEILGDPIVENILDTSPEELTEITEKNLTIQVDESKLKNEEISLTNREVPGEKVIETLGEDPKEFEEFSSRANTKISSLDEKSIEIDQQELVNVQTEEKILETRDSITNVSDQNAEENTVIHETVSQMRNEELPKNLKESDNLQTEKHLKIVKEEAMLEICMGSSKEELDDLNTSVPCEYKETSSSQEQSQTKNSNEIEGDQPKEEMLSFAPEELEVEQSEVRHEGIVEKERKMQFFSEIAIVENNNEVTDLGHKDIVGDKKLNKINDLEMEKCVENTALMEESGDKSFESLVEDVKDYEGSVASEHTGTTSHLEDQNQDQILEETIADPIVDKILDTSLERSDLTNISAEKPKENLTIQVGGSKPKNETPSSFETSMVEVSQEAAPLAYDVLIEDKNLGNVAEFKSESSKDTLISEISKELSGVICASTPFENIEAANSLNERSLTPTVQDMMVDPINKKIVDITSKEMDSETVALAENDKKNSLIEERGSEMRHDELLENESDIPPFSKTSAIETDDELSSAIHGDKIEDECTKVFDKVGREIHSEATSLKEQLIQSPEESREDIETLVACDKKETSYLDERSPTEISQGYVCTETEERILYVPPKTLGSTIPSDENDKENSFIQAHGKQMKHEKHFEVYQTPSFSDTSAVETSNQVSQILHDEKNETGDAKGDNELEVEKHAEIKFRKEETQVVKLIESSKESLEDSKGHHSCENTAPENSQLEQRGTNNLLAIDSEQREEIFFDMIPKAQGSTAVITAKDMDKNNLNKVDESQNTYEKISEMESEISSPTKPLVGEPNTKEKDVEKVDDFETGIRMEVNLLKEETPGKEITESSKDHSEDTELLISSDDTDSNSVKDGSRTQMEKKTQDINPESKDFNTNFLGENTEKTSMIQEHGLHMETDALLHNESKTPSLTDTSIAETTIEVLPTIHKYQISNESLNNFGKFESDKPEEIVVFKEEVPVETLTPSKENVVDNEASVLCKHAETTSQQHQRLPENTQDTVGDSNKTALDTAHKDFATNVLGEKGEENSLVEVTGLQKKELEEKEMNMVALSEPSMLETDKELWPISFENKIGKENPKQLEFESEKYAEMILLKEEAVGGNSIKSLEENFKDGEICVSHENVEMSPLNSKEIESDQAQEKILDTTLETRGLTTIVSEENDGKKSSIQMDGSQKKHEEVFEKEIKMPLGSSTSNNTSEEIIAICLDEIEVEDLKQVDKFEIQKHTDITLLKEEATVEKINDTLKQNREDTRVVVPYEDASSSQEERGLPEKPHEILRDRTGGRTLEVASRTPDLTVSNENDQEQFVIHVDVSEINPDHLENERKMLYVQERPTVETGYEALTIIHYDEIENRDLKEANEFETGKHPNVTLPKEEILTEVLGDSSKEDFEDTKVLVSCEDTTTASSLEEGSITAYEQKIVDAKTEKKILDVAPMAADFITSASVDNEKEDKLIKADASQMKHEEILEKECDLPLLAETFTEIPKEIVGDHTNKKIHDMAVDVSMQDFTKTDSSEKVDENSLIQAHVSEMQNDELSEKECKTQSLLENSTRMTSNEESTITHKDKHEYCVEKVDELEFEKHTETTWLKDESQVEVLYEFLERGHENPKSLISYEDKDSMISQVDQSLRENPQKLVSNQNTEQNALDKVENLSIQGEESQTKQEEPLDIECELPLVPVITTFNTSSEDSKTTPRKQSEVKQTTREKLNEPFKQHKQDIKGFTIIATDRNTEEDSSIQVTESEVKHKELLEKERDITFLSETLMQNNRNKESRFNHEEKIEDEQTNKVEFNNEKHEEVTLSKEAVIDESIKPCHVTSGDTEVSVLESSPEESVLNEIPHKIKRDYTDDEIIDTSEMREKIPETSTTISNEINMLDSTYQTDRSEIKHAEVLEEEREIPLLAKTLTAANESISTNIHNDSFEDEDLQKVDKVVCDKETENILLKDAARGNEEADKVDIQTRLRKDKNNKNLVEVEEMGFSFHDKDNSETAQDDKAQDIQKDSEGSIRENEFFEEEYTNESKEFTMSAISDDAKVMVKDTTAKTVVAETGIISSAVPQATKDECGQEKNESETFEAKTKSSTSMASTHIPTSAIVQELVTETLLEFDQDQFNRLGEPPLLSYVKDSEVEKVQKHGSDNLQELTDIEELNEGCAAKPNEGNLLEEHCKENIETSLALAGNEEHVIQWDPVSNIVIHEIQPEKTIKTTLEEKGKPSEDQVMGDDCNELKENYDGLVPGEDAPSHVLQDSTVEAEEIVKGQQTQDQYGSIPILTHTNILEKKIAQTDAQLPCLRLKESDLKEIEEGSLTTTGERGALEEGHIYNDTLQSSVSSNILVMKHGDSSEKFHTGNEESKLPQETSESRGEDQCSLSDLLQLTAKEFEVPEKNEKTAQTVQSEKTDEDVHGKAKKEENHGEEESYEYKLQDIDTEDPVVVDAGDKDMKVAHKKSHNILSGVGSKVKHSISKVKKAITGKPSHPKSASPKYGEKL